MEPLFFLLLVLCLLATAFSHPLGDSSTVPSSSDVLRGSEKSPLDLLSRDMWFNVGTKLNLYERQRLSSIHNEVLKLLEWNPSERKDLKRIAESGEDLEVFYQAIIKQDIDALINSRVDENEALLYGLQLAIRYRRAHAVWIFLAADWVERERFFAWAKFQKMTETQLEEYTEIVDKQRQSSK